jgi:GNAT superfamily N-acetyltransferase
MPDSPGTHTTFHIERRTRPAPGEIEQLRDRLSAFNRSQIPNKGYVPIFLRLISDDGTFSGGLNGYVSYGWLFIETLWIADSARLQGLGTSLMLAAEKEARKHGCERAWVDTFSFQARRFYEKLGYVVFGELEEYPPGHSRYFLRKELEIEITT